MIIPDKGTLLYRLTSNGDINKLLIISEPKCGQLTAMFYEGDKPVERVNVSIMWLQEMLKHELWTTLEA